MRMTTVRRVLLPTALAIVAWSSRADAQDVLLRGRDHGARPPSWIVAALEADKTAFEFRRAWKGVLSRAKERRVSLTLRGTQTTGIAPARAARLGTVVQGLMRVPVLPLLFSNSVQPYARTVLQTRLFDVRPGAASVTTLYDEMSQRLFRITGEVDQWSRVRDRDTVYEGNNNGGPPELGRLLKEVFDQADRRIDFSRFDRDGDGFVDVVALVQPENGGECRNTNIWSHRWTYEKATGGGLAYQTNDGVKISDYVITSALDCNGGIAAIGTFAHEIGHSLGLPDLYATTLPDPVNDGAGWWSLMATGSYNLPASPAFLDAWSRSELGWLRVDTHAAAANNVLLPASYSGGSAIRLNIPRAEGEYFLLENRQPYGFDRHLVGAGMLVWHIDSAFIAQHLEPNDLENDPRHKGVTLIEADGRFDLNQMGGVADDSDPFPGSLAKTELSALTSPTSNGFSGASGIALRNIRLRSDTVVFDLGYAPGAVATSGATASQTGGPLALISFVRTVTQEDLSWLRTLGYKVLQVFAETRSVYVQAPATTRGELKANPAIMNATVQMRAPRH